MSEWPGATYQQPTALPFGVPPPSVPPIPFPQTRVPPSSLPGGAGYVPQGYTPPPLPWQQPPAQRQQPFQQGPMVAQNQFPRAPSGRIPGALANFSVSDLLNPNVQTPDITELIQQQILAGMV